MDEPIFNVWDLQEQVMIRDVLDLTPYADKPRFQKLQWTGCYDRYGKPIYRGDLVKHSINWKQYVHEVKWALDGWKVGDRDPDYLGNFDDLEVIGNKFENPGLSDGIINSTIISRNI